MILADLLADLEQRGIRLWPDGGQLGIRAPKRALTPALRDQILQHKTEILNLLYQCDDADLGATLLQIVPAPEQRYLPFPLTDMQQAYLVGRSCGFELGNVACHYYLEFESANLDLDRLNGSWRRLVDCHDMLRAVIQADGQQQILEKVPPYQIQIVDLREQGPHTVAAWLEAERKRMCNRVFDVDRWPLFEIRATRLENQRFRLHFDIDLMFIDAWSMFFLLREWSRLYENPELRLEILDLSFRDYVLAEQAFRGSEQYRRSEEYWRHRLQRLPTAPELPLARSLSAIKKPEFVVRSGRLKRERWQRLKSRAAQRGLTPSTVLCNGFAEVLAVWSRRPRFTLNLTLFNRPYCHSQINEIVGDFTSTILLEVDISGGTFESRAQRLQKQMAEDLNHHRFSGVRCLRELNRSHGNPTTATMPVVFTSFLGHGDIRGETASPLPSLGELVFSMGVTPQVWLDHVLYEEAEELVFKWYAVEELFPEGLLHDAFGAYCRFLERLADLEEAWQETTAPLVPVAHLEQRAAVNATKAPIPAELLQTLFAAQVPQRPLQPAVISSRRNLTYEELYSRSTQLGSWLRQSGAHPNTLVAIAMEKGWEQVVAVLGVLQSGAAYLPIDPDLPEERFRYLLKHGNVKLILTQSWLDPRLNWPEGTRRLCVDSADFPTLEDGPLESVQKQEDLAYVIYTSGSTGLPKGVMIDHRGAVNTILDINQRFEVGSSVRVLALSSLGFDLSVYDIFGTLAAGGAIVMPDAGATRDPAQWLELIDRENVTLWNSVPALMQMLVRYLEGRCKTLPATLRLILLSGDWIPVNLPDQIKALREGVQVISLGGATEASIWSILYPIETVDHSWSSIPYGRPMKNQTFHVLNDALQACPTWVPGQLYIGGAGLARGYWQDEEKTAVGFVYHPQSGERLYRTGDLGRYFPDGNIEFLGREDFQVKILGYRVELGEIEAALAQHPSVRTSVVAAVGEPHGDKRLVAYVVPASTPPAAEGAPRGSRPEISLEACIPKPLEGVIVDPIERLDFKLRQPGLRSDGSDGISFQLVRPEQDEALVKAYVERRSYRKFLHGPISFEKFSSFLSCLLQINLDGSPVPKYRYPSAGSLYPVQAYLYIKPDRIERLAAGTYYYHPVVHRLVLLSPDAQIDSSVHILDNQRIFDDSAFSLFLIGQLGAISPMYGQLARDFCLLEAGYISQLLMTMAPSSGIGLCPVGQMDFERIRHFVALQESHVLLHSLLGGRVDESQASDLWPTDQSPHTTPRSNTDGGLVDELRRFLKEKLPDYMIPSAVVILDALPLTPNGKVDRGALRAPEELPTELRKTFVAPDTELERTLATIVQDVLHIGAVGVHDNFFDMGLNSIHMVQVHSRLRQVLTRDLSVVEMFGSSAESVGEMGQHSAS